MNILGENINDSQRRLLQSWRISVRQIGYEVGRQGKKDEAIIPLLHQLRRPTFLPVTQNFSALVTTATCTASTAATPKTGLWHRLGITLTFIKAGKQR